MEARLILPFPLLAMQ